jgi:predicted TIM-barrel fold metal-dependent hydrolase
LVGLVEMGANLEYCYNSCMPYGNRLDPRRMVEGIRRVGAEKCVMATDFGQPYNPHPIDGMRQFIKVLQALGVTEVEIDTMARRNPARLLDLE